MKAAAFLSVNVTNKYQSKAKDSEIKKYPLCLKNNAKYFAVNNMKKQEKMHACTIFKEIFLKH